MGMQNENFPETRIRVTNKQFGLCLTSDIAENFWGYYWKWNFDFYTYTENEVEHDKQYSFEIEIEDTGNSGEIKLWLMEDIRTEESGEGTSVSLRKMLEFEQNPFPFQKST